MANIKVSAIGLNIFPSTPCKARMGTKTIRMISCPKKAEFIILLEAVKAILSRSPAAIDGLFTSFPCSRKTVPSTIITAPSTMIPKSIAPRLIRFAHTSNTFIRINANNRERGMVDATINPPLQLPSKKTKMKITINAPSIRLVLTVPVVLAINLLRSSNGSMMTPSGSDF